MLHDEINIYKHIFFILLQMQIKVKCRTATQNEDLMSVFLVAVDEEIDYYDQEPRVNHDVVTRP